jgi:hypothetical protein
MDFEELDETTRWYMLAEFELEEEGPSPYRDTRLTNGGKAVFPDLMRDAIARGNDQTLAHALLNTAYWHRTESYIRAGLQRERKVNILKASERLTAMEFNTWYVRGLAKRLMDENVPHCLTYCGQARERQPAYCARHDGQVVAVEVIYRGHRARYWPEPGDRNAISIPMGQDCYHSIRRLP